MKQIKALIVKEFQTHWTGFLMPVWFTAGVYAVAIIGWILSQIKGDVVSLQSQLTGMEKGLGDMILWGGSSGMVAMLGMVSLITAISMADSVLNGGFKRKCEILHLSQPVSMLKIAGVKYALVILGSILLFGVVSLFNSLVFYALSGLFFSGHFYYAVVGWFQGFIGVSLSIIFLGSLWWFFAGLFRRKSFMMGLLVIMGIEATISILNYTAGLGIPSLTSYISRMGLVDVSFNSNRVNSFGGLNVNYAIDTMWNSILDWESLLKIVYGAILGVGGFLLYRHREVA